MNQKHAFAYGALVKMAEHNIDPADFVRSAVRNNDPGALKIAEAILEYEKVASKTKAIGDAIGAAGKRVGRFVENVGRGRAGRGQATQYLDDLAYGPQLPSVQRNADRVRQVIGDQNKAMAGAAGLGLAGAGTARAGMTPEDSTANKFRRGLGLEQTSILGGGIRDAKAALGMGGPLQGLKSQLGL